MKTIELTLGLLFNLYPEKALGLLSQKTDEQLLELLKKEKCKQTREKILNHIVKEYPDLSLFNVIALADTSEGGEISGKLRIDKLKQASTIDLLDIFYTAVRLNDFPVWARDSFFSELISHPGLMKPDLIEIYKSHFSSSCKKDILLDILKRDDFSGYEIIELSGDSIEKNSRLRPSIIMALSQKDDLNAEDLLKVFRREKKPCIGEGLYYYEYNKDCDDRSLFPHLEPKLDLLSTDKLIAKIQYLQPEQDVFMQDMLAQYLVNRPDLKIEELIWLSQFLDYYGNNNGCSNYCNRLKDLLTRANLKEDQVVKLYKECHITQACEIMVPCLEKLSVKELEELYFVLKWDKKLFVPIIANKGQKGIDLLKKIWKKNSDEKDGEKHESKETIMAIYNILTSYLNSLEGLEDLFNEFSFNYEDAHERKSLNRYIIQTILNKVINYLDSSQYSFKQLLDEFLVRNYRPEEIIYYYKSYFDEVHGEYLKRIETDDLLCALVDYEQTKKNLLSLSSGSSYFRYDKYQEYINSDRIKYQMIEELSKRNNLLINDKILVYFSSHSSPAF